MKILILLAVLFSLPAWAEESLQKVAEKFFIGEIEVTKLVGDPLEPKKVVFSQKIDKVIVNELDFFKVVANRLSQLNDEDDDQDDNIEKEIFLYAGNDVMNCYANFSKGQFRSLKKCSRIYPKEVSGYGNE